MSDDEHTFHIEIRKGVGVVAVCACGWRSVPQPSAGLAGSLWDRHVDGDAKAE